MPRFPRGASGCPSPTHAQAAVLRRPRNRGPASSDVTEGPRALRPPLRRPAPKAAPRGPTGPCVAAASRVLGFHCAGAEPDATLLLVTRSVPPRSAPEGRRSQDAADHGGSALFAACTLLEMLETISS
ncbi:hypothetical protein HPB47_025931 [Ixodes persulcatus]|uniref:Uncharacterized protein n=1 Tax=Ixodes persulcatus TaxID=34615 RepID=A0AC60Q1S1_IXOPE|nr:hypothetical protein HPB47_025931 [Ixodes persulcatus]